jgi:hypothetical protein
MKTLSAGKWWHGTRSQIKIAAHVVAEALANSAAEGSSPGEAGVAAKGCSDSEVISSANVDELIEVYLASHVSDAWCRPSKQECAAAFTPSTNACFATDRATEFECEVEARLSNDSKQRWLDQKDRFGAPRHRFVELR